MKDINPSTATHQIYSVSLGCRCMQAVSPGQVEAVSNRIVAHTCSTFPGMSGGAGVDIEKPWQLHFIHVKSNLSPSMQVNYGISVHHPLFVKAYAKEVSKGTFMVLYSVHEQQMHSA